jgi:hypothetical protein
MDKIVITDIDIPLWRLVLVLFKVALAAIPASALFVLLLMYLATLFPLLAEPIRQLVG